jgi:hypothetical protein
MAHFRLELLLAPGITNDQLCAAILHQGKIPRNGVENPHHALWHQIARVQPPDDFAFERPN